MRSAMTWVLTPLLLGSLSAHGRAAGPEAKPPPPLVRTLVLSDGGPTAEVVRELFVTPAGTHPVLAGVGPFHIHDEAYRLLEVTAMAAFYDLGRVGDRWETAFRTDCGTVTRKPLKYDARNLDDYDAVVFFTDGTLDMDESQKADLLSFVRDDGKGFLGVHSASITFTAWPEYGRMLGGYFDGHPWGQFDAPIVVEAPDFPGLGRFPRAFTLRDEVYQIKDFRRDDVRVLLSLEARPHPQGRPPR